MRSFVIFCLLSMSSLHADPFLLLRAGRWQELQNYFATNPPNRSYNRFVYARSLEEGGNSFQSISSILQYIEIIHRRCEGRDENAILSCLSGAGDERVEGLIERLSIVHAASIAEKISWNRLSYKLYSLCSLNKNDTLTKAIYTERMKMLLNQGRVNDAVSLSSRASSLLTSPMALYWTAKAHARSGAKDMAILLYTAAAEKTNASYIHKSIYQDIRGFAREVFLDPSLQKKGRSFVYFTPFMDKEELAAFRKAFPAGSLIASTTAETVRSDGFYLIRQKETSFIDELALKQYTKLSVEPDTLHEWSRSLLDKKYIKEAMQLQKRFPHVRKQHSGFWKVYMELLEGNRTALFEETLNYLNEFQSDTEIYDNLIEILIGKNHEQIHWADSSMWEKTKERLPRTTAAGRFYYWLHRYYKHTGKENLAKQIEETFYELAPGSYYARAFWDRFPQGDFIRDFASVRDRSSYLRFIARHGGNEKAIRFLSSKISQQMLDPKGIEVYKKFSLNRLNVPQEILDLYYLGELQLASEFYKDEYQGKISRMEHYARMAFIGKETGNLNLSVYFLRNLLRENRVPEDPFSLPSEALRDLYPRPYRSSVKKWSSTYNIEEEMVYGLMRQESLYRELAISRSGAQGLMQIMPKTGDWLAKGMKLSSFDVMEPDMNIRMGTKFFADLIRSNDGDFRWASIAYNAGPGNLRKWKRQYYRNDFNLFLENVPIAEPRNYCRVTYQNYMHYKVSSLLYNH